MAFLFRMNSTAFACALCLLLGAVQTQAKVKNKKTKPALTASQTQQNGAAEARLIAIYRLIGKGDTRTALKQAEQLLKTNPSFALAQLTYADLLSAQARPLQAFGDAPPDQRILGHDTLADLRSESLLRLKALRERPDAGTLPSEFLKLAAHNKHAIAIDASLARLYLFENRANGPVLVADYYISLGKLGIDKRVEGDQRTPLGVYFITSQLDPKTLKDFYGSGALPINYPNVLDIKRGKTGGGIWLHGTPPGEFSRAPLASNGCLVLANPDLLSIVRQVEIRTTPVLISKKLKWVPAASLKPSTHEFTSQLHAWLKAKSSGNLTNLATFYAPDFNHNGKSLSDWLPTLQHEVSTWQGKSLEIKDLSLLRWVDTHETMVVTFGEVARGQRSGQTRRQYWSREGTQWKIFYESVAS